MAPQAYALLPTSLLHEHRPKALALLRSLSSSARAKPLQTVFMTLGIIFMLHYFSIMGSTLVEKVGGGGRATAGVGEWWEAQGRNGTKWVDLEEESSSPPIPIALGGHFKDLNPVRTVQHFLHLAEIEIATRKLNTCNGQMGFPMALAYNSTTLDFCTPQTSSSSSISCMHNYYSSSIKWWPYPTAYCFSSSLTAYADKGHRFRTRSCELTEQGDRLREDMTGEGFLGSDVVMDDSESGCKGGKVDHTVLVIGRQDQWNPFHVAEDLVTTFLALVLASLEDPALGHEGARLQVVFKDDYELEKNHFTSLWDRIGSYPPRRLSLDPFQDQTCLSKAIHSIGAGASLLSATGVGKSYSCASALTWGSSHYYRHLFGLSPNPPPSRTGSPRTRRPINVLWLSRAQMEAKAKSTSDWSSWRETRHIENEPELVARIRRGLKELCEEKGEGGKGTRCGFYDSEEEPERWGVGEEDLGRREVRFGTIDPVAHALDTQLDFVGHTSILLSLHGGALGLSLFLPPGHASLFELQADSVTGNFHFHNMAVQMGHRYEVIQHEKRVDVEGVWRRVRERVVGDLKGSTG